MNVAVAQVVMVMKDLGSNPSGTQCLLFLHFLPLNINLKLGASKNHITSTKVRYSHYKRIILVGLEFYSRATFSGLTTILSSHLQRGTNHFCQFTRMAALT